MLIAVWFYTLFFGPAFAVGIVVLILIHELGHFIVARWMGLPARLPIFIGPLGAVTSLRRSPGDAGKSGDHRARRPGTRHGCRAPLLPARRRGSTRILPLPAARARVFRMLPEPHQPDPRRLPRRRQGRRRDPEMDERDRPARGRGSCAAVRQSDRADLSRPRHLPHHRQVPEEQPDGRSCPGCRVTPPRSRRRLRRNPAGGSGRHVDRQHDDRQQQLRSRRQPEHRDAPFSKAIGVAFAGASQRGNGNASEL